MRPCFLLREIFENIIPFGRLPDQDGSRRSGVDVVLHLEPALFQGKSGAKHTFDLKLVESPEDLADSEVLSEVAVEILLSDQPIEADEVARIYGKISDMRCDSIIYAVPGLTSEARSYASSFRVRVREGTTIQGALASPEASVRISAESE